MSTFFEKLTASKPKTSGSSAVTADLGAPKRPASAPKSTAPDRTDTEEKKIDTHYTTPEDTKPVLVPVETQKEESEADEEGELTVDIYDKDDSIVIQSTVAGVKPEDLEVSITSDMVSIKGTRQPADRVPEERYYYKELFWGTFARTVILPEEIDENRTEASLKHGLLTISLPKKKRGIAQKVKIKTI